MTTVHWRSTQMTSMSILSVLTIGAVPKAAEAVTDNLTRERHIRL
jgi:hypothetical protein